MASWITDDKPSSGGGEGTTDHRNLTHRNDANQHSGDAIKVTTTWPGDSEPSDKTLTDGIAAVIAASGGGSIQLIQCYRGYNDDVSLDDAFWAGWDETNFFYLPYQESGAGPGIYRGNSTNTPDLWEDWLNGSTVKDFTIILVERMYDGGLGGTYAPGRTMLFDKGTDGLYNLPGEHQSVTAQGNRVGSNFVPVNYELEFGRGDLDTHLQGIDAELGRPASDYEHRPFVGETSLSHTFDALLSGGGAHAVEFTTVTVTSTQIVLDMSEVNVLVGEVPTLHLEFADYGPLPDHLDRVGLLIRKCSGVTGTTSALLAVQPAYAGDGVPDDLAFATSLAGMPAGWALDAGAFTGGAPTVSTVVDALNNTWATLETTEEATGGIDLIVLPAGPAGYPDSLTIEVVERYRYDEPGLSAEDVSFPGFGLLNGVTNVYQAIGGMEGIIDSNRQYDNRTIGGLDPVALDLTTGPVDPGDQPDLAFGPAVNGETVFDPFTVTRVAYGSDEPDGDDTQNYNLPSLWYIESDDEPDPGRWHHVTMSAEVDPPVLYGATTNYVLNGFIYSSVNGDFPEAWQFRTVGYPGPTAYGRPNMAAPGPGEWVRHGGTRQLIENNTITETGPLNPSVDVQIVDASGGSIVLDPAALEGTQIRQTIVRIDTSVVNTVTVDGEFNGSVIDPVIVAGQSLTIFGGIGGLQIH